MPQRPPCTFDCPVHTDARGYVAAVAAGDYPLAAKLIRETNPLASVCAWICAHPCEDRCRRGEVDAPVAIRFLKRFALEAAAVELPTPAQDNGRRVAVVGAGPAGLTAAWDLALAGCGVTLLDRLPVAGGQLWDTVPAYRLPREALAADVARVAALGVKLVLGTALGRDVSLDELLAEHQAVVLALGLPASRRLNIPGAEHPRVLGALEFLAAANRGLSPELGDAVAVVGGGDVAMDVARTALRAGASQVRVACLESREIMPAHPWEVAEALEEGVELHPAWGPQRVLTGTAGVEGLELVAVERVFDEAGRFNPSFRAGETLVLPAATVILAIGQAPELNCLDGAGVARGERGGLLLNPENGMTSRPGVFACGELARGPGAAIQAVASGHRVAEQVLAYLGLRCSFLPENGERIASLPEAVRELIPREPRAPMPAVEPARRRRSFEPFELGLDEATARREAQRCLSCGLGARCEADKCAACLTCLRVCPYGVPQVGGQASMPAAGCQACGICVSACPGRAIELLAVPENTVLAGGGRPGITVFACRRREPPPREDQRRVILPDGCFLDARWLLRAFEEGAWGVLVLACETCRHPGGRERVRRAVEEAAGWLAKVGIEAERLQVRWLAAGERSAADEFAAAMLAGGDWAALGRPS